MERTSQRSRPRQRTLRLLRWVLLVCLVVPMALASFLPTMVEFAFGAPAHVCHCALRSAQSGAHGAHDSCACPICHPDRADFKRREVAVRGPCGDDEPMPPAELPQVLVHEASFVRAPAILSFVLPLTIDHPPPMPDIVPPTPPPKLRATS